jgi:hypothetical protein
MAESETAMIAETSSALLGWNVFEPGGKGLELRKIAIFPDTFAGRRLLGG